MPGVERRAGGATEASGIAACKPCEYHGAKYVSEYGIFIVQIFQGERIVAQSGAIDSTSHSYFARHWRGELPLGQSFWINGVVVGFACSVLMLGTVEERLFFWWHVVALVIEPAIIVWQLVGIWRSAGRYVGPRYLAILARIGAIFGTIYGVMGIEFGTLVKLLD
ncbi:MAG: hypothetical protein ACRECO_15530 [Xanthobacteraceae bacterium]